MTGRVYGPVAASVPYNPNKDPNCTLTSKTTQGAIDELCGKVNTAQSPSMNWEKAGKCKKGSYLHNGVVNSNKTGRLVFANGFITSIVVACDAPATFDLTIQRNDGGGVFVNLATIVITASKKAFSVGLSVPVSIGDELAAVVSLGSAKNIVSGIIIKN